jgi:hypothetical protein
VFLSSSLTRIIDALRGAGAVESLGGMGLLLFLHLSFRAELPHILSAS